MINHPYVHTDIDKTCNETGEDEVDIAYVVYLIDDSGGEFFISQQDELVPIGKHNGYEPLVMTTLFQINDQLSRLRKQYPANCRLFGLEYGEFFERRA